MIYVLSYPVFEPDVAQRIDAFRAEHEPERAKLVPPHITLVFGVGGAHLRAVSNLVDAVSGQMEGFSVEFSTSVIEFDPFENTHKMFLLCGEGGDRITSLHDQLYDGPHRSELSAEHTFKPHMTVASYTDRAALERVDVSEIGDFPIRAQVSALELVQVNDGHLTTLKHADLLG